MSENFSDRDLAENVIDYLMEHTGNDVNRCVAMLITLLQVFQRAYDARERGVNFDTFFAEMDKLMSSLEGTSEARH